MNEDPLPTKVTIDQGNLIRGVIKSWNENLLNVDHLSTDMPKPIQRVQFKKAIARHTKFETKSLARLHLSR